MFDVPLPLPKLVLENIPDNTGFTMLEKRALRNAWIVIKSDAKDHEFEQSLNFFTENEDLLEKFRGKNGKFNIRALHEHPLKMFDTLEILIFDGLESLTVMHGITSPVAERHSHKKVEQEDIKRMSEHLSAYLKKVLRRVMSPTLEKSIDKICTLIVLAQQ